MATQPPTTTDAPFGLQPNLAAFLAYFFSVIGGIIMLVGGGTNKFVKFAAAQAIVLWVSYVVVYIALIVLSLVLAVIHLGILAWLLWMLIPLLFVIAWLWTWIAALQGKEVRLPVIADLTVKFFAAQIA